MDEIKRITTTDNEYEELFATDKLYVVLGNTPDDQNLDGGLLMDLTSNDLQYFCKLRGDRDGPYAVSNTKTNTKWCHGYVIGVSEKNHYSFEQNFLMYCLKTGYGYQKIDVSGYKRQIKKQTEEAKNNLFASLFEEN